MSDLEVQSEIYKEKSTFRKVTILNNSNSLALIEFSNNPESDLKIDEDGDIIVPRCKKNTLELEFSSSTSLSMVGLQIWRGAFLIADFILSHREIFEDKTILELGSGVGFVGIVAGINAKNVLCTDIDKGGILQLIRDNIDRNQKLLKASVYTCSFDFYQQEWSVFLKRKINETNIVIAADVIYDNSLTEAFVQCITKILQTPPRKILYIALEKRYVFTMSNLDSVAPCYEYFLKCLRTAWSSKKPMCSWIIREVKTDFRQFFNYDRNKELVLWEITV